MHRSRLPPRSRSACVAAAAIALVSLTGCAASGVSPTPATAPTGDTHGYVEGAEELTEAQLSLVLGGRDGAVTMLDLVTEEQTALQDAADADVIGLSGDGRFLFRVARSDAAEYSEETSVDIVDSGVWTVEHGDHFHYYRAEPRTIGAVTGSGPAVVHTADRRTAVTFPESGEVVVLDHDDLGDGVIGDSQRLSITPHTGALALPYGGGILVTSPDAAGVPASVEAIGPDGISASAPCAAASSATLTRVGAVFTCATGAVLFTVAGDEVIFEEIASPAGATAPPATALQGRTGRPAVAGIAGDEGAWRLDSRAREWIFLPTDTPLVAASAVSDDADLTVAVAATGRIIVLDAAGSVLATTEPVLAASTADSATTAQVRLIVDAQRAYVSDPAQNRILEIDYRDGARIARTFSVADATFLEQVG